ncbi:MAG: ABC transporter substrate-binding protein [Chloroflexota bacterium]
MTNKKVTRRGFLKGVAVAAGSGVLAACAPQVVKETVIVEKPVEKVVEKVVKETVIVEGTPKVVEKVVTVAPPAKPEAPAPTGQVVIATTNLAICRNLHPDHCQYEIDHQIAAQVTEGLLGFSSKDLALYPRLAKSYEVLEDGKVLAFELREGITFSNGMPLTAEDVKYGIEHLISNDAATNGYKAMLITAEFKEVKVTGPLSLEVHLGKASTVVIEALARIYFVPKALLEEETDSLTGSLARYPIGTGPYIVTHHEMDDITLEARPDYWGEPKPRIQKVVFPAYADEIACAVAFRVGEADVGQYVPEPMEGLEKSGLTLLTSAALTYRSIYMDNTHPIIADKTVRQALMHAIDRQAIIDDINLGWGVLSTQMLPSSSPYFNPNVKQYDYNPEKAVEMLAGAGWTKGPDGVLQKDGEPFVVEIEAGATTKEQMDIAQFVQRQWKEIGVNAEIRQSADFSARQAYMDSPQHGPMVWHTGITLDPVGSHMCCFGKDATWGGRNWENDELSALMEKAAAEFDFEKKKDLMWRLQEITAEELPDFWLNNSVAGVLVKPNLRGITLNYGPGALGWLAHIEEWYWEE